MLANEKRNQGLIIHLTLKEKEILLVRSKRAGMSMSDFIRFKIFKEVTLQKKLNKILTKLQEFE